MTMREPITIDDRGMSLPTYHSPPIIINVTPEEVSSPFQSKKSTSNVTIKESITTTRTTDESSSSSSSSSNATIKSCIINLANTILGAGMLGLPGAFGGTGYLTGLILTLLSSLLSLHGLLLLAQSATTIKKYPSSFYTVARAAVPSYTILIDASVAMKCFGVATGYLITVADCFIEVCDRLLWEGGGGGGGGSGGGFLVERKFWVLIALLGVLPVSFFREFDKLAHASGIALCFVLALVTGIVMYKESDWLGDACRAGYYEEEENNTTCRGVVEATTSVGRTVSKLPIFVFAFTCQQNIFPIVNEIRGRSMERVRYVVVGAILISLIVFVVVAMEGYRTFGSEVNGDIMLNYPETGAVTIMRLFIAVMLILHYPLQLDPSRRCLLSLIKVVMRWRYKWSSSCSWSWWYGSDEVEREMSSLTVTEYSSITASSITPCSNGYSGVSSSAINNNATECEKLVSSSVTQKDDDNDDDNDASLNDDVAFYTVTISFLLLSVSIAMIVDDLGVVLAMVGATGSTLVSYVLPGLIYVKIHRRKEGMTVAVVMAYVQLVLGCVIMPVALYFVLNGDVME